MVGEWTTIGSISEVFDGPHATPKKIEEGPYFLSISSLENGKLDLSKSARISEEQFRKWTKRITPEAGDVLFSYETRLGEAALMPEGIRACLGRRMGLLRPNRHKVDPKFLLFAYLGPAFQQEIQTRTNYGATVERIALKELPNFPIKLPTLTEQKAIAHILGTLDDKIELNHQMNATLEAMALALFKSWFVDFDPVIDNALAAGNPIPEPLQTRAEARKALGDQRKPLPEGIQNQFPNRFVFNDDLGWVPEGWGVGVFGDIALNVKDNVKASEVRDFDFYVGLEHIERKQLFLSDNASGKSIESNKSRFTEKDLLFGKLRPYFHKVCLAPQDGICSTDILVFRTKDTLMHSYMTLTAYREEFVEYANLRSTGTRMPRASAKDMLNYPILIPVGEIVVFFESKVSVIWEKGMQRVEQSNVLGNIRDLLLPKLLSGQLRIPEAEQQIAEAL